MVILVIDVMVMSVLLVVTVNWGVDISAPCTEPLPLLKGEIFFSELKTSRVPLQRGVEQGHPDDAGVGQDGDAGKKVDWTSGLSVSC